MNPGTSRPRDLREFAEDLSRRLALLRTTIYAARTLLEPERCEHCANAHHVLSQVD